MKSFKKAIFALFAFIAMTMGFSQGNLKIVTPLFSATDVSEEDVSVITDYFISKYAFAMRGKAEIVDRNSFNLLVEEQNFQTKDWASKEGRKQLGVLNATHLIKGQLSKFQGQLVVMIWLIDVETGVVYATYEDSNIENVGEMFKRMGDICEYLASQIDGTNSVKTTTKKSSSSNIAKTTNSTTQSEEKFVAKYRVGDTGPGGGYVFFVSEEPFDVFDGKGGVEKCHYLEVSKEELGVMRLCTCDKDPYCKPFTNMGLGYGKSNTYKIISANHSGGALSTKNSAAYACYEYKTSTTNRGDWFLPSFEELRLMYSNLSSTIKKNMTGVSWHWSSSRGLSSNYSFWYVNFRDDNSSYDVSYGTYCVRAVRAF